MIKAHAKSLGEVGSPGVTTQLMTRTTGRNIAAAGLCCRSVTLITSCVRVESRRYREGNAATRRSMTRRTTDTFHLHMQRVIKLHAKALQTWKRFQGSCFYVGVTDGADRTLRIRKLLRMTSGAGKVTGAARKLRARRISLATMTEKTRQPRMISAAVLKFRVIQPFRKLHLFLICGTCRADVGTRFSR